MTARLFAAGRIRHLALSGADDVTRSRVLLAELSALLTTYYRRTRDFGGEGVQRIGPAELRAWWAGHSAELVELHRELARAHLDAAGVP